MIIDLQNDSKDIIKDLEIKFPNIFKTKIQDDFKNNPYTKYLVYLKDNEVIIEVSDNGKGIENIDMAKEPLYTTKPNLERSGMGFTIMESFMDKLEIESIVGLGTKVTMSKKIKVKQENENDEELETSENK